MSFAYNVGVGALRGSTLLRKLNAGDFAGAAEQFLVWNKAGGKVLAGLVKRRAA
ncbi:MAG: lysozyme, partial [Rhizorhabdus sp.]|uniref:lysozyme n=1 Tax=Rhizorhabdus sp. TaxID=1968843 RepID=UPI001B5BB3EE